MPIRIWIGIAVLLLLILVALCVYIYARQKIEDVESECEIRPKKDIQGKTEE